MNPTPPTRTEGGYTYDINEIVAWLESHALVLADGKPVTVNGLIRKHLHTTFWPEQLTPPVPVEAVWAAPPALPPGITMHHERMSAEFEKFHLSGLPFDAVLHHFTGPDRGDFHDHPWPFTTFILSGGYTERIAWQDPYNVWRQRSVRREAGTGHPVAAGLIHRVTDLPTGECWTLVLPGRWERVPGFYKFDEAGAWHRLHNEPDFTLLTC